jgi:hypothetical protein
VFAVDHGCVSPVIVEDNGLIVFSLIGPVFPVGITLPVYIKDNALQNEMVTPDCVFFKNSGFGWLKTRQRPLALSWHSSDGNFQNSFTGRRSRLFAPLSGRTLPALQSFAGDGGSRAVKNRR